MTADELGAPPSPDGWRLGHLLGTFAHVYAAVEATALPNTINNTAIKFFHSELALPSLDREVKALKAIAKGIANNNGVYQKHLPLFVNVNRDDRYLITTPVGRDFDHTTALLPRHAKQVIVTLKFLHTECQILHCDLSPKHFKLSNDGNLFLIDLGSSSKPGQTSRPEGTLPSAATALLQSWIDDQAPSRATTWSQLSRVSS
jgi:hypothetical protein